MKSGEPAVAIWGPDSLSPADRLTLARAALRDPGKAVLVGPVFDTVKLVRDGLVEATLDRDALGWPIAWACRPGLEPPADPPPAEWFAGAIVIREGKPLPPAGDGWRQANSG